MMTPNAEIRFSVTESERFGYNIWRGEMDIFDKDYIKNLIAAEKPDIVILRVPVEQKPSVNQLFDKGLQVLHCDTILYYEYELALWTSLPLLNNLVFHAVTATTQYIVDGLIAENFQNYKNHYYANPALSKSQITEGYKDWAKKFIHEINSNRFSWYVSLDGEVVAFMMCEMSNDNVCQPFLSAVKKEHRKKGVYSDIFKFIKNFFKEKGMVKMRAVTQVQNYVSSQILIKEGFSLKKSFDTYHINCFNQKAANDISK